MTITGLPRFATGVWAVGGGIELPWSMHLTICKNSAMTITEYSEVEKNNDCQDQN